MSVVGLKRVCLVVAAWTALFSLAAAADCPYPNATDTAIHTYNCDNGHKITVTSSRVLDQNDEEMYPVNLKAPILIDLTAINTGEYYYDNKVNVKLWEYRKGFLSGCDWHEIITFGLLDNLDGCDYAHNCPLVTGDLDLRLPLDLSAFAGIVTALLGNNAYQVGIYMFNYNPGVEQHEEIACVMTQMLIV